MNLDFIRQYATALARRRGNREVDEIVAEAFLAYAQATEKLRTLQVTNPDAYTQSWITGACKRAMSKKHPTVQLTEDAATYVMDHTKELVEALRLTPVEYEVLSYRLQGYVDHEIANRLTHPMSQAGVHKARVRIQEKFTELVKT